MSAVRDVARRPTIPPERYASRLARAAELTVEHNLGGLLIGVGPELRYLIGYDAIVSERLTMLVVIPGQQPVLVVPRLERPAAEAGLRTPVTLMTWGETQDPHLLVMQLLSAAPHEHVGVSDRLWASHLIRLQQAMSTMRFESATPVVRTLRVVKDAEEIGLLRLAAQAADRVVLAIAAGPLAGRTEANVAREVRERLIAEGHDTAEFAIVASGPNSASPHHEASSREIRAGEPIVLDIGGTLAGYASDITRTLWVTGGEASRGPDETFRRLFDLVLDANTEATSAVRPGIACERLDTIAREIITNGGFGPEFLHRLGHGIGLEGHEDPYLVEGNVEPLPAGTAFSIEPGIYIDGRYGARIEDIVVCGEAGPIVLNEAPRDLYIVDG
jgi:Xaa-Pro aminopeptidase